MYTLHCWLTVCPFCLPTSCSSLAVRWPSGTEIVPSALPPVSRQWWRCLEHWGSVYPCTGSSLSFLKAVHLTLPLPAMPSLWVSVSEAHRNIVGKERSIDCPWKPVIILDRIATQFSVKKKAQVSELSYTAGNSLGEVLLQEHVL